MGSCQVTVRAEEQEVERVITDQVLQHCETRSPRGEAQVCFYDNSPIARNGLAD